MGIASIKLPSGESIGLVNTHTLPRWGEIPGFEKPSDIHTPGRQIQILEQTQIVDTEFPKGPVIWAGDFNMNQKSDEYSFFVRTTGMVDSFRQTNFSQNKGWEELCTFCSDNGYVLKQRIPGEGILDYIMVTANDFEMVGSKIVTEAGTRSDHLAVQTELRLLSHAPVSLTFHPPTATEVAS